MILIYTALAIPVMFVLGWWSLMPKGHVFEFDPGGHKFMFTTVMVPYRSVFWVIFILSLVGSFVLVGRHTEGLGFWFLMSATCSLLFNLLIVVFYESYLHSKYNLTSIQSNYTATKHSLILGLGSSALFLFVVGLFLAFFSVAGY